MSGPKPEEASAEADGLAEPDEIEVLEVRGDAAALMDLARQKRGAKDLEGTLACYEAAARLGHADAAYAAALFYLSGGVVPQDLKEGTARLRIAADGGVVAAKVYLGNLYELGVHYKADAEKADVWYRAAARAAAVTDEPGTPEYARRLAELGATRYVDEASADATDDEKAAWTKKARTLGLQLHARISALPAEPVQSTPISAPVSAGGPKAKPTADAGVDDALAEMAAERDREKKGAKPDAKKPDAKKADKTEKADKPEKAPKPAKPAAERAFGFTPSLGLRAFGVAALFVIGALAAGWLGMEGARLLLQGGTVLPLVGQQPERVFFAILALVGILPSLLAYRVRTWIAALGGAAVFAASGFWLHGTPLGSLVASRPIQSLAFALAGYLACLFVFGIFGGAKPKKEAPAKKALGRKLIDEE